MYNPGAEISSIDFGAIIGGSLNAVIKAQSQSAQTTVNFIKNVGFQKQYQRDANGNMTETDVPINVAFSYDKEVSPAQVLSKSRYSVEITSGGKGYPGSTEATYSLTADGSELDIQEIHIEGGEVKGITLGTIPEGLELSDGTELKLAFTGSDKEVEEAAVLTLKVTAEYENVPAVMQKMQIQVPILTMMPIPFIKIESADIDFNVKINSVTSNTSESKSDASGSTSVKNGWFVKAELNAAFSNQKSSSSNEEVKKDYSLNIKVHAAQDDMPAGMSRILDMLEESIKAQPSGEPTVVPVRK